MKYRILAVDDEKIVLDSIEYMLRGSELDISLETARNGKEALQKIDVFNPHIILSDIRMPSVDGVDLVKLVRKSGSKVKVVFITAYEQFEYAKVSMKYDVSDYILKPLTKTKLIEAVTKVIAQIEGEQTQLSKEMDMLEKISYSKEIISDYLLRYSSEEKFNLSVFEDILEFKFEHGVLIKLRIKYPVEKESRKNQIYETIYRRMNVLISPYKSVSAVPTVNNNIYYVNLEDLSHSLDEFKTHLSSFMAQEQSVHGVRVNIQGFVVDNPETLQEFIQDMKNKRANSGEFYMNVDTEGVIEESDYETIIQEFLVENSINYMQHLESIFNKIRNTGEINREEMFKDRLSAMLSVLNYLLKTNKQVDCRLEISGFDDRSLDSLHDEMLARHHDYHSSSSKSYSPLIRKVLKYVDRNKHLNIMLENVAKELFVTPQYLSRLFKEETGRTFKEYVLEVKMTLAKQMLMENSSVTQVSENIGYSDVNYFIKSFKKKVGMTPKEYQKVKNV